MTNSLSSPQYTYFRPWTFVDDGSGNNNTANNGGTIIPNNGSTILPNNGTTTFSQYNNNGMYNQQGNYSSDKIAIRIADMIYESTYQVGTNDTMLEQAMEAINSSNVIEVAKAWDLLHSAEEGESFMEAFMWDADSGQKETYCRHVEYALRDRALALDIYEDCKEDFAKIDKELRSWFWISNDISKNFDNIIQKIIAAENKKNSESNEANNQDNSTQGNTLDNVA